MEEASVQFTIHRGQCIFNRAEHIEMEHFVTKRAKTLS